MTIHARESMPQLHLINVQYRKYDDKMTLAIVVTTMMMREREVLGITAVMYTGAATHSPRLHQPRSWSWWWGFDFCCETDICLDVLQVAWTTQEELFLDIRAFKVYLVWRFAMVESFEDLDDDIDGDDGGYPAPDDNDDVTNWRGRECGQIVFYYPSMTICVSALLCNFKSQCVYYPSWLYMLYQAGPLSITSNPDKAQREQNRKNRLLLIIRTYY